MISSTVHTESNNFTKKLNHFLLEFSDSLTITGIFIRISVCLFWFFSTLFQMIRGRKQNLQKETNSIKERNIKNNDLHSYFSLN